MPSESQSQSHNAMNNEDTDSLWFNAVHSQRYKVIYMNIYIYRGNLIYIHTVHKANNTLQLKCEQPVNFVGRQWVKWNVQQMCSQSGVCVCVCLVCVWVVCVCVYAITFCVHLNVINRFMACFIAFRQRLSEISLISLLISHFCDLSANFFPTNFHGFAPQPAVINCANWINCQHAYKYLHSCVCLCVCVVCAICMCGKVIGKP